MNVPIAQYRELLIKYLKPQRFHFFLLAVLLLGSIGLQLIAPQIIRFFIDIATTGLPDLPADYPGMLAYPVLPDRVALLMQAAVLFVGIALAQQIVAVGAVFMGENVGWTATNMMRADLGMHCLKLDMTFHNVRTPGELIERVDGDINELANFFSRFIIMVVGNILLLSGVVVLLFQVDPRVGVVMAFFAIGTLWSLNRVRNVAIPHWARARQAHADFFGYVEEHLSGTEDTRASGAVPYVMRGLYRLMRSQLLEQRSAARMSLMVFAVVIGVITLGNIIALSSAFLLFTAGAATLGTAFIIVNYVNMMFRPLREITMQIQELQRAGASIGRINELYSIKRTILDGTTDTIPDGPLAVSFEHVTFAYNDDEVILDDLNFHLEPGKVMGLLGRTGSGKSTITRLLFRLYDIQQGAIRLGGVDIRDDGLEHLRQRVGIVTQDVQLFRATVRDNLTFFDRTIPDERIIEAIYDLDLGPWFESLPEGLDTRIQSGGSDLSAGQAQLLAFARVFLRDPGLVILDEASSRLDPVTEMRIERAIDKLLHNRTAIIVAHRLGTVQRADQIMVIEKGRIMEYGGREQLADDPASHFHHLLQTGLEEALA